MPTRAPSPALLEALRTALGPEGWEEPSAGSRYLAEPRDRLQGRAALVARPKTAAQAAQVVALCAGAQVGIVPYAGGTGLVGGQVATAPPDPVVLSVERMQQIRAVAPEDEVLIAEAGCTLAAVRAAAAEGGFRFPLRIASEADCRIGGNLATNAGGAQAVRYGSARELCLGLEAILADGRIWDGLSGLRKDNTGYDLRGLLIGSEGTLGVVTAAALRLFPAPAEEATALAAVRTPAAAAALARSLRAALGEILTEAELIDRTGIGFVQAHFPAISTPLPGDYPWYVLAETEGGSGSGARARLEQVLAQALADGTIADAVLAGSLAQRDAIHALRETIPLANRRVGAVATHDVSVPLGRVAALVEAVRTRVESVSPRLRTNIFGHLGDGNLHANVFPPEGGDRQEYAGQRDPITRAVFRAVRDLGGSVSAEHGVGRMRRREAVDEGSNVRRDAMRAIKRALDPAGILNPGAVLEGTDE